MPTFPLANPWSDNTLVNAAALYNNVTVPINAIAAAGQPRMGARATTNVAQSIPTITTTSANNGGTAAWTATEDSGGFVSVVGGTTTPITIPTGADGIYIVGFSGVSSVSQSTRGEFLLLLNGSTGGQNRVLFEPDSQGGACFAMPLAAGNTLGMQAFFATAANLNAGAQVYCYRLSG